MLEKESEWIEPNNLRKQEALERQEVDSGEFTGKGDFGTYYSFRRGTNLDFIKSHGISNDQIAFNYSDEIRTILSFHNLNL